METLDPVAQMQTAITSLEGIVAGVAPAALVVAVAVFGLMFAWRMVRRFVS